METTVEKPVENLAKDAIKNLLAATLLVTAMPAAARTIAGQWVPPGGNAIIEISVQDTATLTLLRNLDASGRDDNNPLPEMRDRPLEGLRLGAGFENSGDEWKGGELYDPASGKTYRGRIRLVDDDHLELRGYVGAPVFGRSETWTRRELFEARMLRLLGRECAQ